MLSSVRSPVLKVPMCTGGDTLPGKRARGGKSPTNANSEDANSHTLSLSLTLPLSMSDDVLGDCCSGDEDDDNIFEVDDDDNIFVLLTKSDDVESYCGTVASLGVGALFPTA